MGADHRGRAVHRPGRRGPARQRDHHATAGCSGADIHLTTLHSTILLATGLLAAISAVRRTTALIFTCVQFFGYLLLFTAGAVTYARAAPTPLGLDPGDAVLHLILTTLAAALFLWLAGQGLEDRWWIYGRVTLAVRLNRAGGWRACAQWCHRRWGEGRPWRGHASGADRGHGRWWGVGRASSRGR